MARHPDPKKRQSWWTFLRTLEEDDGLQQASGRIGHELEAEADEVFLESHR